jgi:hypothetical protein
MSCVFLADKVMKRRGIFLNQLKRSVSAPSVDNDIFQILVSLIEDRPDRIIDEPGVIQ